MHPNPQVFAAQQGQSPHGIIAFNNNILPPAAPAPSEVEVELNRLGNALSLLGNAQLHLAGRLEMVSRGPSPAKTSETIREALTCSLSVSIQAARETADQITARINASIEALAI